jgi:hypothetical protein
VSSLTHTWADCEADSSQGTGEDPSSADLLLDSASSPVSGVHPTPSIGRLSELSHSDRMRLTTKSSESQLLFQ